ncbi:putative Protein kinase domain containing protein [Blattamonas nauphoetae]|uniref:Protein kinase domain-containing protein n=1 Tax=Blattamonas nauphoetae TaxID=2049346 RepID=A0ABQ9YK16_9EUKA|nr:putative Protein kinase domain containing protein [Blattamonas nauphoetae]
MENSTKEHYAGKMIPCVTPKDKERIDREVSRLRQFANPGIVTLKELASTDNMKVIVMELGEQSLADIVKDHTSRGVLVAREVVYRVMVDVSSALAIMHREEGGRTAHGDVKMENILLFPGGHFKLCDLGAAESENGSSTPSVMSQQYVSPERVESDTTRATCSSDVWALGIVLHWLLFGEAPFKSKSILKLGQEITSFQVSMIGESCGGEERALLTRMLDPNPGSRVTSSQLCSLGVFRSLVNTTSALWKLKDADDKEHSDKLKISEQDLSITKRSLQQAGEVLRKEREDRKKELEMEKNAHSNALHEVTTKLNSLKEKFAKLESERTEDQAKASRLEQQLKRDFEFEKHAHRLASDSLKNEQITVRRLEEALMAEKMNNTRLERELAESRLNQTLAPYHAPQPHEQIETPLSLVLANVTSSQLVETEIEAFFSQFGYIIYLFSNPPSNDNQTPRFYIA